MTTLQAASFTVLWVCVTAFENLAAARVWSQCQLSKAQGESDGGETTATHE